MPEIISTLGFARDCFAELRFRLFSKDPMEPTHYWDTCASEDLDKLVKHLSNTEDPERILIRELISLHQVQSILDVGCGPGTEFQGYQKSDNINQVQYFGLDLSQRMLNAAKCNNPKINLLTGSAERLPFGDSSIDAVLLKHILEHQPKGYAEVVSEAIRVAAKIVIVNFFHPPLPFIKKDFILRSDHGYVNNWYSRSKFEDAINKNEKVKNWEKFASTGISGQKGEIYLLEL